MPPRDFDAGAVAREVSVLRAASAATRATQPLPQRHAACAKRCMLRWLSECRSDGEQATMLSVALLRC